MALYNGIEISAMDMIMIILNHFSSNYACLLISFSFILGPFSIHHIVACQILHLSLNFSQIRLNLVWFLAKNEYEFSLILCILSLISIVGGLFGSSHVVEQLLFSVILSIPTLDFDLILGYFLLFRALMGYFWGGGRVQKLFCSLLI